MARIILVLCLMGALSETVVAQGGWWGNLFDRREPVGVEKILERPDHYLGLRVPVVVQLKGTESLANPYYTRFEKDRYANYAAWPDGVSLWEREVYEKPLEFFFVRRGSSAAKSLGEAGVYSRWHLTVEVADVVKGVPWIEILSARPMDKSLDEGALIHIVKARTFFDLKRYAAAAREYHKADSDALPNAVRLFVLDQESDAWSRAGQNKLAHERALVAMAIAGEDPAWIDRVARFSQLAQRKPGNPLTGIREEEPVVDPVVVPASTSSTTNGERVMVIPPLPTEKGRLP